jgi:hypothetical protein
MIESAARAYQPGNYEGNVLLLLASERPSYVNYLAGWKAVVRGNLSVRYVNGSHTELLSKENAGYVAEAIASHLTLLPGERPASFVTGFTVSTCFTGKRNSGSEAPFPETGFVEGRKQQRSTRQQCTL